MSSTQQRLIAFLIHFVCHDDCRRSNTPDIEHVLSQTEIEMRVYFRSQRKHESDRMPHMSIPELPYLILHIGQNANFVDQDCPALHDSPATEFRLLRQVGVEKVIQVFHEGLQR